MERLMPRFPLREVEILQLAQKMIAGFKRHPEDFPAPYVSLDQMERELADAQAGLIKRQEIEAEARKVTTDTRRRFKTLRKTMVANLRYAEIQARKYPRLLHAIGWGPRRPKRPMRRPGEVRALRIVEERETAIVLRWRRPLAGGRVATYHIQRRRSGLGGWEDVGTSVATEAVLDNQERGVEYEYRVLALNKAGDGPPSSTVRAVL